jgi:hypothetical protein
MPHERFDLSTIFDAAIEYACAISCPEAEGELDKALRCNRIDTASDKLTRNLGLHDSTHLDALRAIAELRRPVCYALKRLAFSVWVLNGGDEWLGQGLELLGQGALQLWGGMNAQDREPVRHLLSDAYRIWAWPRGRGGDPKPFSGPVEFSGGWIISGGCAITREQFEEGWAEQARQITAGPRRMAVSSGATRQQQTARQEQVAAIQAEDVAILRCLEKNAPVAVSQYDIEPDTDLSRRTIGPRLKVLRNLGYTAQPRGPRGGETITAKGRQVLQEIQSKRAQSAH